MGFSAPVDAHGMQDAMEEGDGIHAPSIWSTMEPRRSYPRMAWNLGPSLISGPDPPEGPMSTRELGENMRTRNKGMTGDHTLVRLPRIMPFLASLTFLRDGEHCDVPGQHRTQPDTRDSAQPGCLCTRCRCCGMVHTVWAALGEVQPPVALAPCTGPYHQQQAARKVHHQG